MSMCMKKSVQRALAHHLICGVLPRKIHIDTLMEASKCLDSGYGQRQVLPQFVDQAKKHPLYRAHQKLTDMGFVKDCGYSETRNDNIYLSYHHPDYPAEALACYNGTVVVIRCNDTVPYRQSWTERV